MLIVNGHFIELVSLEAKNHSLSVSLVAYLRVNYQIVGSLSLINTVPCESLSVLFELMVKC